MKVELFSLCEYASDMQGKLNVFGTFDSIRTHNVPIVYPICHLASRIRYERSEKGKHNFEIYFVDEDGRSIIPEIKGEMEVKIPEDQLSAAINLVIGLGQIQFNKTGKYSVDLVIDGRHEHSLPLTILNQQNRN